MVEKSVIFTILLGPNTLRKIYGKGIDDFEIVYLSDSQPGVRVPPGVREKFEGVRQKFTVINEKVTKCPLSFY